MRGKISKKYYHFIIIAVVFTAAIFMNFVNRSPNIVFQSRAADWYDFDWRKRTSITIDDTKVAADLTDFPVLINSTNTDWKSVANGGNVAQDDGGDFVFTASDNTTKLSHEIEKYDPATGELIAWVKVPALADLTDTVINLYYGNESIADQWDVANVWGDATNNVWHLKEDPSGTAPQILDSTARNNRGTSGGSMTSADLISGKVGTGIDFDGNDLLYFARPTANIDNWTMEIWVKPGNLVGEKTLMMNGTNAGGYGLMQDAAALKVLYNGVAWIVPGYSFANTTDWVHAVAVRNSGTLRVYANGVPLATTSAANPVAPAAGNNFGIGYTPGLSSRYFTGQLDEARFSLEPKTSAYIATEYNNQNAPSTFYALGITEDGDTTPPTNPTSVSGYDTSGKENEMTNNSWAPYDTPYFEWSGAADEQSGLEGYWVYWGTDETANPVTEGDFQAYADTNYVAPVLTSGQTYYLRIITENNATSDNLSEALTLFTYKYDPVAPPSPEYINVSPVGCSTSTSFTFSWPAVTDTGGSDLQTYQYRRGSTGTVTDIDALTLSTTSYQEGDNIFYLRSLDNAGNTSSWQTSVYCSTATVQVVDGPTVDAGPSSITVSWVSSKETTGYVKVYEGNTYISEQGLTNFSLSHAVKVIGLEPEKAYRYQITWTDQSGNLGESDWYETNTATAPQINNLSIDILSPTTLNISWSSTIFAKYSLEYGIGSYGTVVASGDYLTGYSGKIVGLAAGSTYQFRVNATGEDGTKFFAGESVTMPPLPSIGSLKFEPIKDRPDTAVAISWTTNVELTSSVYFGPKGEQKKEISKSDRTKDHEVVVGDLLDNSEYEIYASGIDQYGNVARSSIQTLRTEYDSRPPKIENISTESSNVASGKTDTAQITIGYTTDEPARCFVDYGIGISGENYSGKTALDEILQTNHISVLSNLTPQSPYHFKISCSDKAGNQTESADQTVISGEITPSVFNIILKTLNSLFGWLGKVVD